MPVNAVVGDVGLAADEPLHERRIPLEGLGPLLEPEQLLLGQLSPEFAGLFLGALVQSVVGLHPFHVGMLDEFGTRWKYGLLGHSQNLSSRTGMAARRGPGHGSIARGINDDRQEPGYSYLRARIGSIRVARYAGTYPASNATVAMPSVARVRLSGSFGLIP